MPTAQARCNRGVQSLQKCVLKNLKSVKISDLKMPKSVPEVLELQATASYQSISSYTRP